MTTRIPHLLIAASGTGGHLFPALAVAEVLPAWEIDWLGVPDRLENQLVGDRYPLHLVRAEGFQKRGLSALKTSWRLLQAVRQVRRLLREQRIDLVFTTGGYIAGPAIVAARSLGIPVLLHESNALPGKTTRLLSRLCTVTAVGLAEAAERLPGAVVTGTPLRQDFKAASRQPLPDWVPPGNGPLVVVVGGSQGAVALNRLVRGAIAPLLDQGLRLVHLTGSQDPELGSLRHPNYAERPFWDEMAPLLARADLVVSRAGAGTLAELTFCGTPSLLVPYPFAAEDHQTFNARILERAGAARLCPQSQLTVAYLRDQLTTLLRHRLDPTRGLSDPLPPMAAAAAGEAVPDSAQQVAAQLATLVR